MKVEAIFSAGRTELRLVPENDMEAYLLGSALDNAEADIVLRHEGHISHQKVACASIVARPAIPKPIAGFK